LHDLRTARCTKKTTSHLIGYSLTRSRARCTTSDISRTGKVERGTAEAGGLPLTLRCDPRLDQLLVLWTDGEEACASLASPPEQLADPGPRREIGA
jgi:hypothetical protein